MEAQDKNKFKEIISMISETYSEVFTPVKLKLWWTMFKPYPVDVFEMAVYSHISNPDAGMFTPKPANIIKLIEGDTKENEQALEDNANIAWSVIVSEMQRIGSYGTLEMDDKLALAALMAVGGWRELCMTNLDKLKWIQKDFVSAYKNYDRADVATLPQNLPGRIYIENHKKEHGSKIKSLSDGLRTYQSRIENK